MMSNTQNRNLIPPAMLLALLLPAIASSATSAAVHHEQGPQALAAQFTAQIFQVPVESVNVTIVNQDPLHALAEASVNGNTCRIEMAQAPKDAQVPHGWLIGSLQCKDGNNGQ